MAELRLLTVPITAIMEARLMQTSLASTMAQGICISSDSTERNRSVRSLGAVLPQPELEEHVHAQARPLLRGTFPS